MWTASHWERQCGLCDNRDPSPLQCSNNILSKYIFSCNQAALRMDISVCLSVCPSVCDTFLTMFPSSYHHENFRSYYQWCPCRRSRSEVKVTEVKTQLNRLLLRFEFTYDDEMMHKAWWCLEEVPYCFSMSSVKFQGHTAKKSSILTQFRRFRTVTPIWIDQ